MIQVERAKPESQRDWTKVDRMAETLTQKLKLSDAALAQFEIEMLVNKDRVSEARRRRRRRQAVILAIRVSACCRRS